MTEHENGRSARPDGFAMDEPLPAGAAEPVDAVQVRADEALIAALSAADDAHVDDPIDERLADLLQAWRDDVQHEPARPLVDVAAARAAIASAPRPRHRSGLIGPWATAAAVLVVAFVGMGLAARGAEPGDTLWNVTKVLYSEKAKSVEAAAAVRLKLEEATEALQSGNIIKAKVALDEARSKLPVIAVEDGQQDLASRTDELLAELGGTTTPPPPLATSPVGVPPSGVATSSSKSVTATQPPPPVTSTQQPPPPTTTQPVDTTTVVPTTTTQSTESTNPGSGDSGVPEEEPRDSSDQQSPGDSDTSSTEPS